MDNRSEAIRGTGSHMVNALKNESSYWVTQINLERRRRGLPAIPVSGKGWDELSEVQKRGVKSAQVQDRLQAAKEDAELFALQQKLAALKAQVGES